MSINIGFMYTCVLFYLLQPLYGTPDFLESNSVKFLTVLHLLHCGILSEMILSECHSHYYMLRRCCDIRVKINAGFDIVCCMSWL